MVYQSCYLFTLVHLLTCYLFHFLFSIYWSYMVTKNVMYRPYIGVALGTAK